MLFPRPRPQYSAAFLSAVAVALVGLTVPSIVLPALATLMPATLALKAVLDATIFVLILRAGAEDDLRARLILALTFLLCGVLALGAFLVVPGFSTIPPLVEAPPQTGTWLYIEGHLALGAGGLIFWWYRTANRRAVDARFTLTAIAVAVTALASGVVLALAGPLPDRLFAAGQPASHAFAVATGAVALVSLVAGIALLRLQTASANDRAFGYVQLILVLEVLVVAGAGERYSLGWCAAHVLLVLGPALMLTAVFERLMRADTVVRDAENALEQSARRAARIRALVHVASHDTLNNADYAQAVIDVGRTALRTKEPMFGMISHIDNGELVVDAISWSGDLEAHVAALRMFVIGRRFPIAGTVAEWLTRSAERTAHWNAIDPADAPSKLIGGAGWRHVIAAAFRIENTAHFMLFGTTLALDAEPFAEDDVAFVDVLASQLAQRAHRDAQFSRIRYQNEHDQLTGLHNRTEFRKALHADVSSGRPFGLALLDLDGFRFINETSGHLIGDELLVEVAATLRSIDERDFVARLGGDDFGILMHGIVPGESLAAKLSSYAEAFTKPFHAGDRGGKRFLRLAASIGAASFPQDGTDAEDLMRSADVALGAAKERDGGTTVLFNESMTGAFSDHNRFRTELLEAFESDALFLEYQPTFDIGSHVPVGAEALVRWNHPVRGRMSPADFVPFADRAGLAGRLSRWVLKRVFADLAGRALPIGFRCYVNLQARLLDDAAFLHELETRLAAAPHLAKHLGIEITESEAMQNPDATILALLNIRRLGLRIAIDDFGTGYSSMAYLKRLPIDVVKIDRTFIAGLPHDEKDAALGEMFLHLTQKFGFISLAEGIETHAQSTWLREHGCMQGQGFLVSQPLPIDRLSAFIA